MDSTGTVQLWRKLLASVVPGEMTVRQWCEGQGVSLHQYYYWRRRVTALAEAKTQEAHPPTAGKHAWLPVEIAEPTAAPVAPSRLTVCIAGAAIDVAPGFDPSLLRAVVEALGAQPC